MINNTCSRKPTHAPDRALSLRPHATFLPGLPSTCSPTESPPLSTRQGCRKPGAGCQQKCQTCIPPACGSCGAGSSTPSRSHLCSLHVCTGVHLPQAHVCGIVTLPCTWQVAPSSGNLTDFSQQPCRDSDQPQVTARGMESRRLGEAKGLASLHSGSRDLNSVHLTSKCVPRPIQPRSSSFQALAGKVASDLQCQIVPETG